MPLNYTNIEYCDMTWNPVTGCLHGCEYCYARKIANRFGSSTPIDESGADIMLPSKGRKAIELENSLYRRDKNGKIVKNPYPFGFTPTFHKYRLNAPQKTITPKAIFVGSMCDLFGPEVPADWIEAALNACRSAPQHKYLLLTKNPGRYSEFIHSYESGGKATAIFYGATATNDEQLRRAYVSAASWLSIEPLQEELDSDKYLAYDGSARWSRVVIGAETGNQKSKVIPKRRWIENIVNACADLDIPVFMKDSLIKVWEAPLIREVPWK